MKKEKNKKIMFLIVGIIVGLLISCGGVYAATYINAVNVGYSNSTSGLTSTNMQDALDEAYKNTEIKNRSNIVQAYTYNASTCVTGNESTCVKTTCYKTKTAGSCPAGTIIQYKVNDLDVVTFHVMYDNGTTMTMQSQKNTINNTPWISASDYATYNTDSTSCIYEACNDEGPMTALVALERATKSWTNVNYQTYTMGTTTFKTNAYTGCDSYSSCAANLYTLDSRTAKARMITLQEAVDLGCTSTAKSCPNWMNNYLYKSTIYGGGTVNDSSTDPETGSKNEGYWTVNASTSYLYRAWSVDYGGRVYDGSNSDDAYDGARAVVVVSK